MCHPVEISSGAVPRIRSVSAEICLTEKEAIGTCNLLLWPGQSLGNYLSVTLGLNFQPCVTWIKLKIPSKLSKLPSNSNSDACS